MTTRFGMRLDGWMPPQACVDMAIAAEQAGLDAIWFAENPFGRGVLPAMTACGLATKSIGIGAGVFNPFARHPSLMAMEMGALDELLSGRSILGVGTGVQKRLAQAHIASDKPIAAMRDTIEIVRALMRGEAVEYSGKVFSSSGVKLEFTPYRTDYPIFLASMGDQSIRLAGRLADGVMISNLCTRGFTRRALDMIASDPVAQARKTPFRVVQYAPLVAGPDRTEARNHAKTVVGRMIREAFGPSSTPATRAWHHLGSGLQEEAFFAVVAALDNGTPAAECVSDEILDLFLLAGDRSDIERGYQKYMEAGVTDIVVTFRGARPVEDMQYLSDFFQAMRPA